jgi:NitT/TauT family transport system substrate-binding protein
LRVGPGIRLTKKTWQTGWHIACLAVRGRLLDHGDGIRGRIGMARPSYSLLIPAILIILTGLIGAPHAKADDPTHIKLGITKLGAMTNVWVAARDGIFRQHGLDVELVDIPMTMQAVPVLQSKSIDIVLQIPGSAMMAKERGFDLVLVGQNETAGTAPPVSNALMVATASPANSVKDLRGLRIGTASPRGQTFAVLKELFQRNGLSDDDVQWIEAPFTAGPDLLRTHQVDALITLDPYTTQITRTGTGRTLSWFALDTVPDQPVGAWWATRAWAEQHKPQIAEFQDAIRDSHAYLNADPVRAKHLIAEYSGLDPALVKDMPLISWKSKIDPAVWQAVIDMMVRQGELTKPHNVAEYLVN